MRKLALALALAGATAMMIAGEMRLLIVTVGKLSPMQTETPPSEEARTQNEPPPGQEAIRALMDRLQIDLPISIAGTSR